MMKENSNCQYMTALRYVNESVMKHIRKDLRRARSGWWHTTESFNKKISSGWVFLHSFTMFNLYIIGLDYSQILTTYDTPPCQVPRIFNNTFTCFLSYCTILSQNLGFTGELSILETFFSFSDQHALSLWDCGFYLQWIRLHARNILVFGLVTN